MQSQMLPLRKPPQISSDYLLHDERYDSGNSKPDYLQHRDPRKDLKIENS
jgi:hypothetical protein